MEAWGHLIDWYLKVREVPSGTTGTSLAQTKGLYQAHGIVTSRPSRPRARGRKEARWVKSISL